VIEIRRLETRRFKVFLLEPLAFCGHLFPVISRLLLSLLIVLSGCTATALAEDSEISAPSTPVVVRTGFYLVDLTGIQESSQTFDANFYFSFQWMDPRLKFEGTASKIFLEGRASAKLGEIWWPQIEFVNTSDSKVINQKLEIWPDGKVDYSIGVSAKFRGIFRLQRFPFDRQMLDVRIQSFAFTKEQVVFEPNPALTGTAEHMAFEGVTLESAKTHVTTVELKGWNESYSEFRVSLEVVRKSQFYLWTIFVPVGLVFFISCAVFLIPVDQLHDRVGITLTAILACIATQFAMSFNLPQISYLTRIDLFFAIAYVMMGLQVVMSAIERRIVRTRPHLAANLNMAVLILFPVVFLVASSLLLL